MERIWWTQRRLLVSSDSKTEEELLGKDAKAEHEEERMALIRVYR